MNEIVITVSKEDVIAATKTIAELQQQADSVTEESASWEVKKAYHTHGISQGYINCMRNLGLLPEPVYSRLFIKQHRIAEKIKLLQEKRTPGTANTEEPAN